FRFSNLPTDLALIIFEHAAQPTFAEYATYTRDPYSSALSLCQVSKTVRRTVLPELLDTVLLPKACHLVAFVRALRMQKKYNDQQHDLAFDYASRVHKMSIGGYRGPLQSPFSFPTYLAKLEEFDISLLAPVILGVSSLEISYGSLEILLRCLKNACNSDVGHGNSPLAWSMRSLTLLGDFSRRWWPFVESVHGRSFLASVQHLTLLFAVSFKRCPPFQCKCISEAAFN
ncbi:uncharacterized protein EDB93DRAFT_1097863, partial [Suillus bovinus]|uniref:uncharacterized protein n=1 Tax=Suillus bovinus TaxID=48563 RepID=UPI001B864E84